MILGHITNRTKYVVFLLLLPLMYFGVALGDTSNSQADKRLPRLNGSKYYSFTLSPKSGDSIDYDGYANIEWTQGEGQGTLCINNGPDSNKVGLPLRVPITSAKSEDDNVRMMIGTNSLLPGSSESSILLHFRTGDNIFNGAVSRTSSWYYDGSSEDSFSFEIKEIPNDPKQYQHFLFQRDIVPFWGSQPSIHDYKHKFYPMSVYDRMTPQQAIAFEHKHPPFLTQAGYEVGTVQAVIDPKNIGLVDHLLQSLVPSCVN